MKQNATTLTARIAITAVVSAVFLMAGCAAAPAPSSNTQGTQTKEVLLEKVAFSPQELTVAPGTTVKWVNKDDMPHDVTGKDKAWQSTGGAGAMKKGTAYSKTFTEPGTYEYYCVIHSSGPGNGMWGKIVVQ